MLLVGPRKSNWRAAVCQLKSSSDLDLVSRPEFGLRCIGWFIRVARSRTERLVDEDIENALADFTFMNMVLFPFP